MKAISLMQPWATLIAIGAKRIETRSWSTNYRGPLAIHASKQFPAWARELCHTEPFASVLAGVVGDLAQLPLGALVAVTRIVDCQKMDEHNLFEVIGFTWDQGRHTRVLTRAERAFGDYRPGRFAWILDETKPLPQPVMGVKGSLGLWECESRFLPKGL